MLEEIKNKARELLKTKQAEVVIGYQRAADGIYAMPCFVTSEADIDNLIWDAYCVNNLSVYLKDYKGKKAAIIAKPCDVRAIVILLQENQLNRPEVFIIAVECRGVINERKARSGIDNQEVGFDEKCRTCDSTPLIQDFLIKDKKAKPKDTQEPDEYAFIKKLEAKSQDEKLKLWNDEFQRCIRCYACRQVCPMCYCPVCVADQAMPAWFSKAVNLEGNLSWNVVRAMHLAGRCIDCGECQRACPVGIPLRDINKKIEKDVQELFNYESGKNIEQKPLLSCFDKDDPGDFIR